MREDHVIRHRVQMVMSLERCIYKPREAKNCQQTPEAGRGKKEIPPRAVRGSMVLLTPQERHFRCFKKSHF